MEASAELKTDVNLDGGGTGGDKPLTSEAIVAELFSDFVKDEKHVLIHDAIAGDGLDIAIQEMEEITGHEKHKKRKKEKKSKKTHRRERSRSRERKHKRSISRSKKSKKRKTEHGSISSKTYSSSSEVPKETGLRKSPDLHNDGMNSYIEPMLSEDDDLPLGADYRTVLKETKNNININDSTLSFNLESLPSDPCCSMPKQLIEVFPLSKETKIDDQYENECTKNHSNLLKKVLVVKGKCDFVPRNVKLKTSNEMSSPKSAIKSNNNGLPIVSDAITMNDKPDSAVNVEESISDTELEKKIEKELQDDTKNVPDERWTRIIEESVKKIEDARSFNVCSHTSSPISDKPRKSKKKKEDRSSSKTRSRERSRRKVDRSLSPDRTSKQTTRKRYRSDDRHSRSRSHEKRRKSRSPNRRRRRSRSRSHRRSRSRSYNRRRYSSRERGNTIDKNKLREIAQRKAKAAGQLGITDPTKNAETVEDFISYCEKLQKRQEKECRRERGERVSSDDDSVCERRKPFQHPYGIKPAEPIKINIVNATQLPTKTPQECILDASQLRVVFPVSSGVIHKESSEWKRVEPAVDKTPVTCLSTQKNHRAMSSLQVERARIQGVPPPVPTVPMLPIPPTPPTFSGFHNKLTAFDLLVPPPPPLPPTLIVPSENEMIMSEPVKVEKSAPRDVARVLASRAQAQRALAEDPNDYDSRRDLKEANDQMAAWAAARQEPGKFTGSTGLQVLTVEELQPRDPRFNSWVKKDMFKTARPAVSQVGMRLMMNMGWRPGCGLGREETGSVEPLTLDVKSDRKGLQTFEDLPAKMSAAQFKNAQATDVLGKNPVSLVMELCAKRRWANPIFTCHENGPCTSKSFLWTAEINNVTYQPAMGSKVKKDGKALVCQVVLQALGVVPRDPNLPVRV